MNLPTTHHLDPKHDFYPIVLLPGDPARAMAIATAQLEEPRMFNHRRGLWGYSGKTPGGTGLVIQSTGMGGPSAAIVCEELVMLGAEVLVRVGTCGAIDASLRLGDLVVVESVFAEDGASRALGAGEIVVPDQTLTDGLAKGACAVVGESRVHLARVASADLFYDSRGSERLVSGGAVAAEMEAAAVLSVAARHGKRGACLLGVTDELYGDGRVRMGHEEIVELGDLLGAVAVAAVA